jgi:hypothetical protein
VRPEGLGKLKKIIIIGSRTRDLPACSIGPQLPTPRSEPEIWIKLFPSFPGTRSSRNTLRVWTERQLELPQESLAYERAISERHFSYSFVSPKYFVPLLIFIWYYYYFSPPLWSSGQSSWLQIRRPGFNSRHYQKKK